MLDGEADTSVMMNGNTPIVAEEKLRLGSTASIGTLCAVRTALWVTAKVVVRLPAVGLQMTLAGTVAAAGIRLDSVTAIPAEVEGPLNVKVPVTGVFVPPITNCGEIVSPMSPAASTLTCAVEERLPPVAAIVAVTSDATGVVVTLKYPTLEPAAIFTVFGTVTELLLEDRLTIKPPDGALASRYTAALLTLPPITGETTAND